MNYEEYYEYCRNTSKISDKRILPDLDVNNQTILKHIKDYNKKIIGLSDIINNGQIISDHTDPLFVSYPRIQDVPEVMSLGNEFCKILSKDFFGCQIVFDRVECYQNKVTNSGEHSSWKWHYDDSAPYRYKIMIYLSNVEEGNGGMRVLLNSKNECITFKSSRIRIGKKKESQYLGSRIPQEVIDEHIQNGYMPVEITGEIGTTLLFHQNIAHKATIPNKHPGRTCIIYNFRPYHKILTDNFFIDRTDGSSGGGVKDYSTYVD